MLYNIVPTILETKETIIEPSASKAWPDSTLSAGSGQTMGSPKTWWKSIS